MKRVTYLQWSDDSVAHIARHGVKPEEAEDVCFSMASFIERGRGDNVYYVTGQTPGGRYLFVVVRYLGRGLARVITARDTDHRERSRYKKRR